MDEDQRGWKRGYKSSATVFVEEEGFLGFFLGFSKFRREVFVFYKNFGRVKKV